MAPCSTSPSSTSRRRCRPTFSSRVGLGLAFHPNYAENGRFYVYYADYTTNGNLFLVEYTVSSDNPNQADPERARLILSIDADPYVNHNGETKTLTMPSPPRLKQYVYYSDTPEDRALGMQGIMTIFI